MDHKEITEKVIVEKYLLGKLNSAEADAFEEHLFFCESCMEELDQIRTIIETIQTNAEKEIIYNINKPVIKSKKRNRVYYLYTAIAVAAALATLAIIFVPKYYQRESENKSLRDLSKIERKKIKNPVRKQNKEIKEPKNFANNPEIIKQQQQAAEPSYASNPVLDSSINDELAFAEIRGGAQQKFLLIDPLPANDAKFKSGEKICFKWRSNYKDLLYKIVVYDNKGNKIHEEDNIKGIKWTAEFYFQSPTLIPGLYYWRVIPSEDIEYPHTGKFKITK
ncbi:MAG TPA: zf-HC2 domain-containing protein [Bacteroidales bacterium]|nr:zf-HC2 domain-containing protein [Bacteroidales bacterium]